MGMYDSLLIPCPTCGKDVEFQSKEAHCVMDVWRSFDETPTEVLWDVMNEPEYCRHCGGWMALVDPAHPPGPRPRPKLHAVKVKTPENPTIHRIQDFIRWWPHDVDFTLDHIDGVLPIETSEAKTDGR